MNINFQNIMAINFKHINLQNTSLYTSNGSGNLRYAIQALVNFNFIFFAILAADNTCMHNNDVMDIEK